MLDGEGLADHAADREAHVVDLVDAERAHHRRHVQRQLVHGVVAGDRIAAAMAAHVDAEHAIAGAEQRRHLLRPHAAVGRERMSDAEDGTGLGSIEVVIDPAAIEGQQHRFLLRLAIVQRVGSAALRVPRR
jgi:hypothetical protein